MEKLSESHKSQDRRFGSLLIPRHFAGEQVYAAFILYKTSVTSYDATLVFNINSGNDLLWVKKLSESHKSQDRRFGSLLIPRNSVGEQVYVTFVYTEKSLCRKTKALSLN